MPEFKRRIDTYIDDNITRLEATIVSEETPEIFRGDFEKELAVYKHLKKVQELWLSQ